jgi:hypothetical protein
MESAVALWHVQTANKIDWRCRRKLIGVDDNRGRPLIIFQFRGRR